MNCGTCAYFESTAEAVRVGSDRLTAGYCHRYPPAALNPSRSAFPFVHEQLWCGEHRGR